MLCVSNVNYLSDDAAIFNDFVIACACAVHAFILLSVADLSLEMDSATPTYFLYDVKILAAERCFLTILRFFTLRAQT